MTLKDWKAYIQNNRVEVVIALGLIFASLGMGVVGSIVVDTAYDGFAGFYLGLTAGALVLFSIYIGIAKVLSFNSHKKSSS
ncbi:hypothetical protein B0H94_11044 [Salsuginibacillus halophilus]|uniref:Uncharacterized protein n=1 Tax=Salsuginibacillus halophilus TaxID=517424 RepID=A0A2P8HBH0_9BACI|nr:hypothetical protein [Salsuginibacillus halophilus]PSL43568.1 hypothetical protein B0H94_11044 [Salsuginibacillus halophilus]